MPTARPDLRTRVQLCGRLSVELDGAQVADRLRGRQARMLLVYLLLNRRRLIPRRELIAALWPEHMPVSAEAALRTLLSRVRAALGPETVTGRDEITLNLPEPVWIDLEAAASELQRAVIALEQGDCRTAWAVAQVPLNIAGRGLVPGLQASWLDGQRAELEDIRLQALEAVGGAGLIMGGTQLGSVERAGRALIDADPFRESGYVLLMRAAARRGNPAAAVRVFERLRRLMREELGTAPSAEAIAVYERVLSPDVLDPFPVAQPPVMAPIELPAELQAGARAELVGREEELGELLRLWAGTSGRGRGMADRGRAHVDVTGRVVVLRGEAGIGKTSLATRLAEQAHADGGVVLAGRAAEEGLAPYQPFIDAIRHYFATAELDEVAVAVREYGPELAQLVPEIRRRVPDLPSLSAADAEGERYRLFESVVGLLSAISDQAPILLLLDDMHWADRPTLLLLRHLARAPGLVRMMILIAARDDAPAEGLLDLLSDLARENVVREHDIEGLDRTHTSQLVQLRTGHPPSRALTNALHQDTQGNPLFIEEIVHNLMQAGVDVSTANASALGPFALPEGIKRLILRRLDRLDTETLQWLRVASVIGREFDFTLLEEVTGLGAEELLRALEAALAAGVAVESANDPGCYSFAHALIREALYEGMSAPRRARIHRQIGEALEAAGHAPVGELARHFTLAAERDGAEKAMRYALEAAEEAAGRLAYEAAVEHYSRAINVLRRFEPDEEKRLLSLLLAFGETCVKAGERGRAWEAFREAADLAELLAEVPSIARAAIGASRRYIVQPGVVEGDLVQMLDRALEMTAGEVSTTRVCLLARQCGAVYYSPQRDRMQVLSQEADRLADQLADPEASAYAAAARRRALWDPRHLQQRLAASTEMLRHAQVTGDAELVLQAHAWLVVDLLETGDRAGVDAQIAAFKAGAGQVKQPLYLWQTLVWTAMAVLLDGALERAADLADEALAVGAPAERITSPDYHIRQLFAIRREQSRLAELEQPLRELTESRRTRPLWATFLAVLLAETGRLDEARGELERLGAADFRGVPQDGDWMPTIAMLGELACDVGDAERALTLHDMLLPYAGVNVVIGLGAVCLGPAARLLGRLAALIGRRSDAEGHLERALDLAGALRAPVCHARARLDYARILESGPRALRMIEDAASVAEELGLPALAQQAERLRKAARPSPG